MSKQEIIDTLVRFRSVDKYESFHKILPSVVFAPEALKQTVSAILDDCCQALIHLYQSPGKPNKQHSRRLLIRCMDELTHAAVDAENREFGYELGWYLAEKAGIDLGKGTETKVWGFWKVEANEVRSVLPKAAKKEKITSV